MPRLWLIRRFAEFANQHPWQWAPGEVEAFTRGVAAIGIDGGSM